MQLKVIFNPLYYIKTIFQLQTCRFLVQAVWNLCRKGWWMIKPHIKEIPGANIQFNTAYVYSCDLDLHSTSAAH